MIKNLEEAVRVIKFTIERNPNKDNHPYFFIVGAGISAPEIPTAQSIIDNCKQSVKKLDEEYYNQCINDSEKFMDNHMRYYSTWIEHAFPNRRDRSNYFKQLNANSKISSANLMLAKILNSKSFANTVFTTNFDDSLKRALELMGATDYFVAENIMDNLVISNQNSNVQIVHVHGTYNFYDSANLEDEIDNIASQTSVISSRRLLQSFLANQAPIIVGYSGWENDVIMKCLKERLSYPTPLKYIWVCYDNNSFNGLPDWIRNNDNFIFIKPEKNTDVNDEKSSVKSLLDQSYDSKVDATMFFRRIISEFKLPKPLVFSNPYKYYSDKIRSSLTKDEDVLFLRHWAQRLSILESTDNEFDKLITQMENASINKNYEEASNILSTLSDMALSNANSEFVCYIINEFIADEDRSSNFDLIYNFHISAINFIEKQQNQILDINNLLTTLSRVIHISFNYKYKDKIIILLDKVCTMASQNNKLLEVELLSLGMKSSLVDELEEKKEYLKQIICKCPKNAENNMISYSKFVALIGLCFLVDIEEAVEYVNEAERILPILENDQLNTALNLIKSKFIGEMPDPIKTKWLEEVIDFVTSILEKKSYEECIDILLSLNINSIQKTISSELLIKVENTYLNVIKYYDVSTSNHKMVLDYAKCCEVICSITENIAIKIECCNKVFGLKDHLPRPSQEFLAILFSVSDIYFSLSNGEISDNEKKELLVNLKTYTEKVPSNYSMLLETVINNQYLKENNLLIEDAKLFEDHKNKLSIAYDSYCEKKLLEAEQLFLELIKSPFYNISETAKIDLCFMIRRNEVECKQYQFWEVVDSIDDKRDPFISMNIMLYCIKNDQKNDERYKEARAYFYQFSDDDLEPVKEWWDEVNIVGVEEHELALSIINRTYIDNSTSI